MATNITKYQKFNPDDDYEIDDDDKPEWPDDPDVIVCCQCEVSDTSLCKDELSFGATTSYAIARTLVYWGTWE